MAKEAGETFDQCSENAGWQQAIAQSTMFHGRQGDYSGHLSYL
jgi:hypothetical protein